MDTERWQSIENKLSKNHLWKCTPAEKKHRKGRAKGGITMAVKKNLKEVKIRELNKETEINLEYNGNRWRIITLYSRKIEDTIGSLLEYIQEEEYLLMGGDFNARTGNKGGPIREEKEEDKSEIRSKDKVINKGRTLINNIEERGWTILNRKKREDGLI